jgi:RNase H-like domain found in reverse transcriptase/Integrase zinc binding domain
MTAPVLCQPDFTKPFVVDMDASAYALGAVLQQKDEEGHLHPIAFMSCTFDSTQRNWDIADQELFAIVEAFCTWRAYLASSAHKVTVHTDHHNLQYFKKPQNLNRQQVQWNQFLADYDFELQHVSGKKHIPADFLSCPRGDKGEQDNQDVTVLNPTCLALMDGEPGYTHFPEDIESRQAILQRYHDHPLAGHPGIHNTIALALCHFKDTKELRAFATEYVRGCAKCQETKMRALRKTPLYHLDVPAEEGHSRA